MLRAEVYNPDKHETLIQDYMSATYVENNKNPRQFRLQDYNNITGVLFLVIDQEDQICAVSSVLIEESEKGPCAKIYGRFHIKQGTPHTIIDEFFEPMTFQWCAERQADRIFFTVNQGNYKVLDWSCRRIGERRNVFRPNMYYPQLGSEIRAGFIPLPQQIYERFCWQYAIYYSPDGEWFLNRPTQELDLEAKIIFRREFPRATQNWK